jgi:hypothetical protein
MAGRWMTEKWESQVTTTSRHPFSCQLPNRRRSLLTDKGRNINGKKMKTSFPDFPAINFLARFPALSLTQFDTTNTLERESERS